MDILLECLYSGKSTQCSFQEPSLPITLPSRVWLLVAEMIVFAVAGCQVSPPRLHSQGSPNCKTIKSSKHPLKYYLSSCKLTFFSPTHWSVSHSPFSHRPCVSQHPWPRHRTDNFFLWFIFRKDNPDDINEVPNIITSHNWCYTLKFWLQLSQQNN